MVQTPPGSQTKNLKKKHSFKLNEGFKVQIESKLQNSNFTLIRWASFFIKLQMGISWSQLVVHSPSTGQIKGLKGVSLRKLSQCNISNQIDEFTLNPMVPLVFMPQAWQNFEIFDSKVKTLRSGSYEKELKKWFQTSFLQKNWVLPRKKYIHSKE